MTVDFESSRSNPEFIVSYEKDFRLPWMAEYTELQDALEMVYGRPISLVPEKSDRGKDLRAGDCVTTAVYAA